MNLERVQSSASPSRKKILVLEDDILWQKIIRYCVLKADENADIEFLSSAKEFHESQTNPKSFDLIISDYYLAEGQTGIEFWKQLQADGCKVPFVMTSGCVAAKMMELFVGEDAPPVFLEKTIAGNEFANNLYNILKAPAPKTKKSKKFKFGYYEALLLLALFAGITFGPRLFTQTDVGNKYSSDKAAKPAESSRKPANKAPIETPEDKETK